MSQVITNQEVLTLEETADYLRVSLEDAEQLATRGQLPARRIKDEWRFLRSALDEWLRGLDYKQVLLGQAGALKDDTSLDALRGKVYADRGRPEVGAGQAGTQDRRGHSTSLICHGKPCLRCLRCPVEIR